MTLRIDSEALAQALKVAMKVWNDQILDDDDAMSLATCINDALQNRPQISCKFPLCAGTKTGGCLTCPEDSTD